MRNFSHLINIPYNEMDCWKLAKKFYADVLNIELKNYFNDFPKDRIAMKNLIYTNMGDFSKTDSPKFGDIILLKFKNIESHIAINIDGGTMLHTMTSTGSVIDRKSRWSNLIVGYYTTKENL